MCCAQRFSVEIMELSGFSSTIQNPTRIIKKLTESIDGQVLNLIDFSKS